MKKQTGFTLIELVVVIVLIVVLGSTALVRFLNIQTDAKNETLEMISAQIEAQVEIVRAKMILAGLDGRNQDRTDPVTGGGYYGDDEPERNPFLNICGHDCYFIYGTPSASATTLPSIMDDLERDIIFSGYHSNDWVDEGVTGTDIVGTFSFKENVIEGAKPGQNSLRNESCYIWYSGAREDRDFQMGIVPCE